MIQLTLQNIIPGRRSYGFNIYYGTGQIEVL